MESYIRIGKGLDKLEVGREVTNPKLYEHRRNGEFMFYLDEAKTDTIIRSLIRDGYVIEEVSA